MKIIIRAGTATLHAQLRETPTAIAISAALPIKSVAQTWGKEVYFSVPVAVALEADAKDVVQPGELAFWVEGNCIALGFGPTPISHGSEIRLAARTNIWADAIDDVTLLEQVHAGDTISVEQI